MANKHKQSMDEMRKLAGITSDHNEIPPHAVPNVRATFCEQTDDQLAFLSKIMMEPDTDPILKDVKRKWAEIWTAWEAAGKSVTNMKRVGAGNTESDTLMKSRLIPVMEKFHKRFGEVLDHLKKTSGHH